MKIPQEAYQQLPPVELGKTKLQYRGVRTKVLPACTQSVPGRKTWLAPKFARVLVLISG
jgi:hypothetical protein